MRRPVTLLLLAALAVGAGACELALAAEVGVEADGSGRLEIAFRLDRELADLLADSGVDVLRGVAAADTAAWEVEEADDPSGREVRLVTTFDGPAELGQRLGELDEGLGDDGAILDDVELAVDEQGAARFRARAGLALPTATGAPAGGVAFDAAELDALTARGDGERAARYDLRVTLPGMPVSHDADARDGRILTWRLPIGHMRRVRAVSGPPRDPTLPAALAAFGIAATLAAVVVLTVRRR